MYFPSEMLTALHEERVRAGQRRALPPARRWQKPGRARSWPALSTRTRAGAGEAGLLVAGAKP